MEEVLTNEDKNNNGIPDWAEERVDDQTTFPEGDLGHAFTSEEKIAAKIPNYKDYKWYRNPAVEGHPNTGYFYTLGEKIENAIESDPVEAQNVINEMAEQNPEISKEDVKPVLEEAKQAEDGGSDAEVNNEVVEKAVKKLGAFLPDLPERKVSQEEYDNMSLDDIAAQDELAMKGEGDYITVANDMGLDEEDLYYFDNPAFIETLTPEQKEEVKAEPDKKKKIDILSKFVLPTASVPDVPTAGVLNSEESTPLEGDENVTSGVSPTSPSFPGSNGGSGASGGSNINVAPIEKDVPSTTSHSVSTPDLLVRDENDVGSQNGTNANKGVDDQFDALSFDETKHEENIKSNEQFELNGKEGHTAAPNKLKLPKLGESKDITNDIKKAILEDSNTWENNDSKGKFLPFRFLVDNDDIIVSQIGTSRKLPFEEFIKKEPTAIRQIMEKLG